MRICERNFAIKIMPSPVHSHTRSRTLTLTLTLADRSQHCIRIQRCSMIVIIMHVSRHTSSDNDWWVWLDLCRKSAFVIREIVIIIIIMWMFYNVHIYVMAMAVEINTQYVDGFRRGMPQVISSEARTLCRSRHFLRPLIISGAYGCFSFLTFRIKMAAIHTNIDVYRAIKLSLVTSLWQHFSFI